MTSAASAMLLANALFLGQFEERALHKAPFIEVRNGPDNHARPPDPAARQSYLLYHEVHWGLNYQRPVDKADWGNPEKDFSRLPTTYFHPKGPLGVAFQKFNWFPGPSNTFHADARIVASLMGLGGDPRSQLAATWSDPPVAALGLATGTEAAYARPFQTVHYVERNPDIIALSQPAKDKEPLFQFVPDARQRGAALKVLEGEHRATFAKQGGEQFYHLVVIEAIKEHRHEHLHTDLLTKEAMQMLMSKAVEEGVLCYHTSHRHIDIPPIIASVAEDCGYAVVRGRDSGDWPSERGHFSSEWVMVARKAEYLKHLKEPEGYKARFGTADYWSAPKTNERFIWRDGEKNSYTGLWRSDPAIADLQRLIRKTGGFVSEFGLPREPTFRFVRAAEDFLRSIDKEVTAQKNREPQ